jgi:hypothetical protein
MMPLDGGRLLNVAVFSRHPSLETAFTVLAGASLGLVGLAMQSWLTAGLGIFTAFAASAQRRLISAAHEIRPAFAGVPAEPALLTEDQRKILFLQATEAAEHRYDNATLRSRARLLASNMQIILDRATIAPTSAVTAVLLVLAYLASCTLLLPLVLAFS